MHHHIQPHVPHVLPCCRHRVSKLAHVAPLHMQSFYARRARVCKAGSLGGARTHRCSLATIQATTAMGSPAWLHAPGASPNCLSSVQQRGRKQGRPSVVSPHAPTSPPPISQRPGARARAVRSGGAILGDHQQCGRRGRARAFAAARRLVGRPPAAPRYGQRRRRGRRSGRRTRVAALAGGGRGAAGGGVRRRGGGGSSMPDGGGSRGLCARAQRVWTWFLIYGSGSAYKKPQKTKTILREGETDRESFLAHIHSACASTHLLCVRGLNSPQQPVVRGFFCSKNGRRFFWSPVEDKRNITRGLPSRHTLVARSPGLVNLVNCQQNDAPVTSAERCAYECTTHEHARPAKPHTI